MKTLATISLIGILISLISCSSPTPSSTPTLLTTADDIAAQQTLIDFFHLLNEGNYQQAVLLYSGSYDWLISINPAVSPSDHATLLEYGCLYNGLQCFEVSTAVLDLTSSPSEKLFLVEFNLGDGSLFVRGPCCGANETEQPPVSQFQFHVVKLADGSFKVADLPIYVP